MQGVRAKFPAALEAEAFLYARYVSNRLWTRGSKDSKTPFENIHG